MHTLNIIGCGRVGRTLARLWAQSGVFELRDVLNPTPGSAAAAVDFAGAGRPVTEFGELRPADVWMITPPDAHIVECCEALVKTDLLRPSNIVFHCSGAMPSHDLSAAKEKGAHVASVHPLKSFAQPAHAVATFAGTYCAAEGDAAALQMLCSAFEKIGGRIIEVNPEFKTIYHAASVIVCNYLTALLETGLRCYEKSGLSREAALHAMEPLVRDTLDNVFRLDTVQALTGPIARGDDAVVAKQIEALSKWDSQIAELYKRLGAVALELSRSQGGASTEALSRLAAILGDTPK